jgi:hypothetical protein
MLRYPAMRPKRALLETDGQGRLKSVPELPPDAKIEATFIVIEPGSSGGDRQPPAEFAGIEIVGDIMSPAVDENDWDIMK